MLLGNKLRLRISRGLVTLFWGTMVISTSSCLWAQDVPQQSAAPRGASKPSLNQSPSNLPPPSVHVPDRSSKPLRQPNQTRADNRVIYSLGDRSNQAAEGSQVDLTSYQVQDKPKSSVPDILVGSEKLLPPTQAMEAVRGQQFSAIQGTPTVKDPSFTAPLNGPRQSPVPPSNSEFKPAAGLPATAPATSPAAMSNQSNSPLSAPPASTMLGQTTPKPNETPAQPPAISADPRVTLPSTLEQPGRVAGGFPVSTQQPFGSPPAQSGLGNITLDRPSDPNAPEIRLAMPAIEIEAFGPRSVGIYKASKYKIVARNLGNHDAEKMTVNIAVPQWIQVENLNASIGRKEVTTDQTNNQIRWTIDRLVAGAEQTLILDMTAIKADRFALQLDCSLQPQVGVAHVEVTEPRLEMKIAGPNEVLFGETATYNVVVRNPGTGTAENVTVMLPEALGGERATLGDIEPGKERKFSVELLARTAGRIDLATTASAAANLQTADSLSIMVRRPALQVAMVAPEMVFSGTVAQLDFQVANTGDAMGREIVAAVALPPGVKYLSGIETAEVRDETIRWSIGNLDVGEVKKFTAYCELVAEGTIKLELAARGAGDIGAATQTATLVETVADMTLSVDEPAGPLPTGKDIEYVIHVKNRGSKAAKQLNLVMLFGKGIDPVSATGLNYTLADDGQVIFNPITTVAPGEELSIRVVAQAHQPGTHLFRVHLESTDKDTRKMFEGTTKFYGAEMKRAATAGANEAGGFRK